MPGVNSSLFELLGFVFFGLELLAEHHGGLDGVEHI